MTLRLAGRLTSARHSRFVGRNAECALFQSILAEPELSVNVLLIYGPGGIGKSTLLREFVYRCEQSGVTAVYIDSRNVEPAPESLLNTLRLALNLTPDASPFEAIAAKPGRVVILLDTYEILASLDDWIREVFVAQLPENALIVLAGRQVPSPGWRTDPGWQTMIRTVPLRNLAPQESKEYLSKRNVPAEQQNTLLDFTHGHPLALSLVADVLSQRPNTQFRPEDAPDVVRTLLNQFVQKVPSPAHRAALEICALVRVTTESLLAEMLKTAEAHELFDWLRGLSFIESGQAGLFPHDLAREALSADVKWRNPDWHIELHKRARNYYTSRLQQTRTNDQQSLLYDLVYLHRDNPVIRSFFEWQSSGSSYVADILRAGDEPTLIAMAAQHEGPESAQLIALWLKRQPNGVTILRQSSAQPAGFLVTIALHHALAEDIEADPGARAVWTYLRQHAPLRHGEGAAIFRFWMTQDYQSVSVPQSLLFIHMVRYYLVTPGLAFTFLPCAVPDFWAPAFTYANLSRLTDADFEVGGRRYGIYGHDWRAEPTVAWLSMLAEKEMGLAPEQNLAPKPVSEPLVILSEPEFAEAVREALRNYTRASVLRESPLVRSRLVSERASAGAGDAQRVVTLQGQIREAVNMLQASPRDAKLYRAVYHTYIQPAPTQEQAAEILDVPFSTYRRHLHTGIVRVTEALWQQEIHGAEK